MQNRFGALAVALIFNTRLALAYPHLDQASSKELTRRAQKICHKVKKLGRAHLDPEIIHVYKQNCEGVEHPTLSKMLIELYHAREHLLNEDSPKATAFQKIISVLGHTTRKLNDTVDPEVYLNVSKQVRELSGFALDTKNKIVWGQGDHGQTLVSISLNDFSTKKNRFDDVKNKNWEAAAIDTFGKLWLLDIGDNYALRDHVQLIELQNAENQFKLQRLIRVNFSNGPRDCEAAFFYENHLYLIEKAFFKSAKLSSIEIKNKEFPSEQVATATPSGELPPLGYITDAQIVDGHRLFVLTHYGVYEILNWKERKGIKAKPIFERFLGQAEAFAALSPTDFLIGREDGKIFRWKNGDFIGPKTSKQ